MDDVSAFVEREFARRAAESERTRLAFLAAGGAIAAIAIPGAAYLLPETVGRVFHGRFPTVPFASGAAVLTAYALLARAWVDRLRARGATPPTAFRYVVAAVETSLPTAVMLFGSTIFGPLYALFTPPSFAYFFFIALSALHLDLALSVWTGAVAALGYGAVATWGVLHPPAGLSEPMLAAPPHHLGKVGALLITGVITGLIARSVRREVIAALRTMAERDRVVRLFGEHVSPAVVDKLLSAADRNISEVREVCVLFLDIRDFTTFSEGRPPAEVVDHLNGLFEGLVEDVNAHGGIVNKFLGDGFMAVFGAPIEGPDACAHAVAAARAMLARVESANATAAIKTRIGMGLHAGAAITGHVGSARRREYTVMGDVVNVASRIEGLNKQFASQLLVSDAVRLRAGAEGESLGDVAVKGREQKIGLWKLA